MPSLRSRSKPLLNDGDINCYEGESEVRGSVMGSAVVVLGLSFSLGI